MGYGMKGIRPFLPTVVRLASDLLTRRDVPRRGNTDVGTIAFTAHDPDGAPTVAITTPASGVGCARLRWLDPDDDETGYRVERAVEADTPTFALVGSLGPNATTFKDVTLPSGVYLYRVRVVRGAAIGPACEAIRVRVGKHARMTENKVPLNPAGARVGARWQA